MYVTVDEAAALLLTSNLVAIPTETVWGLAACASDQKAVEQIFIRKNRPQNNPLILHIDSPTWMYEATTLPIQKLLPITTAFWPGSLTLVVPVFEEAFLPIVRAGLPRAAFRIPQHETTCSLLKKTGPLVAPSANRSGKPSATQVHHIIDDFGETLPILRCDKTPKGIESTILIWHEDRWFIGRYGALPTNIIQHVLGYTPVPLTSGKTPLCPGQMHRHYAPQAQLFLSTKPWDPTTTQKYDAILGFSDHFYKNGPPCISLGKSTEPIQIAQNLFHALRLLDEHHYTTVFVDYTFPKTPAYLAIHDRLQKAAAI